MMHVTNGWADLGFVDHSEDFIAEPAKHATDFGHDCLCHTTIIDGVEFMAHSPACERPGHGLHYRYVSSQATPSADPIHFGPNRRSDKERA